MTPAQIIALINAQITSNGIGAITGPILNNLLQLIVGLFTSPTGSFPARLVSTSTALNILLTDYAIGLQRTFSLSAMTINLPSGATIGQSFVIDDLVGNLNAYPATLTPPVGQTIAGRATYVMDQNFQSAIVRYYGANVWGIET